MLPSLVEAAAGGINGSNLTVLNGAQGVNEMAVGVVSQGLSIFDALRRTMSTNGASNGHRDAVEGEAKPSEVGAPKP